MSRILMSLAVALCVAGSASGAQEADKDAKDAPKRPDARESAPAQAGDRPAAHSRGTEEVREQPAERPWWVDAPGRSSAPPERVRRQLAEPDARFREVVSRLQREKTVPQPDARVRELFQLKNALGVEVAEAVNELLRGEAQRPPHPMQDKAVVVAEPVSNSLLVSGTANDVEQLGKIIQELDQPPQMVLIQMLIAQSTLADADGGSPAQQASKQGGRPEEPEVVGLAPGSQFSAERLKREVELGVLGEPSAKQGIDERLGELEKRSRLEVLSRPQLMTLDNQPASIHVGSREPMVRSSQQGRSGPVHQFEYVEVGQRVSITPRVEPDGWVTMEIEVQISQLGPPEEGPAVSASPDGRTVRASRVVTITAETTVRVADGHTVVLAGLTSKSDSREEELLLVLTPRIVDPEAD
ncbi:MAG TPA: secretin N-terminal domain-containing protein [Thermoguttaceae bacterium]|nr:secretin N-terminal domain-containing protein [Thermoguttaceae bacterium]